MVGQAVGDDVPATVKSQAWDRKKEEFLRHRLCCFVSEVDTTPTWTSRQNTTHYSKLTHKIHEQIKQLKLVLKMVHYLPALQEFFRVYPTRTLLKDQHKQLSERLAARSGKLAEAERMLPYLALCLDFKVANRANKCLAKLMLYGRLPMRLALIDQMVYFVKELMLESTDEHQLI
jgi:hypothetical protein